MPATPTKAQLERLVEAAIGAALAAVVTDRPVSRFWTPVDAGEVKELPNSAVEVRVLPRENVGYDNTQVNLHAVISITAAKEDDATGASLPSAVEAVLGVVAAWDTDDDAAAAALDIAGLFRCDSVMFAPGGDCGWDDTQKVWFASVMVDIAGCLIG